MIQDWNNVEIGKRYKLEDGYDFQVEVEVLEKDISNDEYNFVDYKVKIIKIYRAGDLEIKEGDIDRFGKSLNPKFEYLVQKLKFLDLDDGFSYT